MREIRRFVSDDELRRVTIYETDAGHYRYEESHIDHEDMIQYGMGVMSYWTAGDVSGIFGTAEDAERDARLVHRWLDGDSN